MTAGGKHTHHQGQIVLTRVDGVGYADHSPQQNGAVAYWEDGTTSYVLHTRSGHVHGPTMADEMDTVIQLVDAIRGDEDMTPGALQNALKDVRRLRTRLEAIENEAILYAREPRDSDRPAARLTPTEIAEELCLDHSTVVTRHRRMAVEGKHAAWRHWLVQQTERDDMYRGETS